MKHTKKTKEPATVIRPDLNHYKKVESGADHRSFDFDVKVVRKLRGKSLGEAYAIAADFEGVPVNLLRAKYSHLNVGQQRTFLGNRLCAATPAPRAAAAS